MLATGEYDEREVYLHDYDAEVYRTSPTHTLNGLHWGYPDGIVMLVTGECPEGTGSSTLYTQWVTKETKRSAGQNSRFCIVKYKEAKAIIELGIRQKLDKAKVDAEEDVKFLADWEKTKREKFPKYLACAFRIDTSKKGTLDIVIIKPERFVTRGMGTFLENIKQGEVSISPKALKLLEDEGQERRGLNGLEMFHKPLIIAGMIGPLTQMKMEDVSVAKGALGQLREVATIED